MEQKTILVVDDDPDITETIRFNLEQEGYQVLTSGDGASALGTVRLSNPDLIILDVMMPKENGYRVAKIIKEDQEAGRLTKKIPIILLTARNLKDDPEREKMFMGFSHADMVIYKPFKTKDLLKHIHDLLM